MKNNKLLRYGLIFLVFLCLACVGIIALTSLFPTQDPTPAVPAQMDISEIIAQTAGAAQAQTLAAHSPTSASTASLLPTSTYADTPLPATTTNTPLPILINTATLVPYIPPPTVSIIQPPSGGSGSCCKVCTNSKACGDSCISRDKTCHQPPGCACDG